MKKFLSSGGLGDAWICFLKIIHASNGERVVWDHMTGHQIHVDPITELMTVMPDIQEAKCHKIDKKSRPDKEKFLMTEGTIRLNTKAGEIESPTPDLPVINNIYEKEDYVVVQPGAGRPNDNSFRYFMPYAVDSFIELFKSKNKGIVLLGAEYKTQNEDCFNLTNKSSIKTSLQIIRGSKFFIGFDGFLAYAAMSMKIPSIVIFHDPILPDHYMNKAWEKLTTWTVGPQRISDISNMKDHIKC